MAKSAKGTTKNVWETAGKVAEIIGTLDVLGNVAEFVFSPETAYAPGLDELDKLGQYYNEPRRTAAANNQHKSFDHSSRVTKNRMFNRITRDPHIRDAIGIGRSIAGERGGGLQSPAGISIILM